LRQAEKERQKQDEVFRKLAIQIGGLAKEVAKGPDENRKDVAEMRKSLDELHARHENKIKTK
jgi:uncharacterized protein with von Willebrand factor type A (vWA) domain